MKLNRKNKLLIGGFVLTLYLCYAFAFSSTLEWRQKYLTLSELEKNGSVGQEQLKLLIAREKQLDRALQEFALPEGSSYQGVLLKKLSAEGRQLNVKVIDFREPHRFKSGASLQFNYFFTLQGSFNSMLQLINRIEADPSFGIVKHLKFEKKKNYRNNTFYLIADVVIQKSETIQ